MGEEGWLMRGNWSCDLRDNERPHKNCILWRKQTEKLTDGHGDSMSEWLNWPSGENSVKNGFFRIHKTRFFQLGTLQTAHCTLHIAHCTLRTAHCTKHTAHCTLYTEHYALHNSHCTLHTAHSIIQTDRLFSPIGSFIASDNRSSLVKVDNKCSLEKEPLFVLDLLVV